MILPSPFQLLIFKLEGGCSLIASITASFCFLIFTSACANSPTSQSSANSVYSDLTNSQYQSPCLQIALQNKNSAFILGYGNAKNIYEAKQQALYDIANQIEVNVSGESNRTSEKISRSVNSQFSQQVKTSAQALLSSVETICSDLNDPSGKYHFALLYDQRSLADIFASQLEQSFLHGKPRVIDWQGSRIMINSAFVQKINHQLINLKDDPTLALPLPREGTKIDAPSANGSNAQIPPPAKGEARRGYILNRQSIKIQLFRKDQHWYLKLNNIVKRLESHDFAQLFNWDSIKTHNISVLLKNEFEKTLKPHLQDGDEFRFVVTTQQKGYLSVFDIYEDGRVTKLRDNIPFNNKVTLPEHGGSFSAGLLKTNQSTRDHYVFLVTKEKIDSKAFRQLMIEENSSLEDKNYTLNLFLFWLDQQPVIAASNLQVETVPR